MKATHMFSMALMLAFLLFGCAGQVKEGGVGASQQDGTNVTKTGYGQELAGVSGTPVILNGLENGLQKVPDPLSGENEPHMLIQRSAPAAGEKFKDPVFKTSLVRITSGFGVRNEYSRFDPFNHGGSMIVLLAPQSGSWKIFRTASAPYDTDANFVRELNVEDPRWDPVRPDIIWGLRDFSIMTINVTDGSERTEKDFSADPAIAPILSAEPDLYQITMNNEGESSLDKRYWAFILKGSEEDYRARYLFAYDMARDNISGIYKIGSGESSIDWVGMSPLGSYVLIGGDEADAGNISGFMMADRQLKKFHKLDYATAHSDTGLDTDGREVLVMQNTRTDYIDMIPIDWKTGSIDETGGSYSGTGRTPLMRLFYDSSSTQGFGSGMHISCNSPGYCVVSTYIEPGVREQNWLDRSIVLVKLNATNPETYYLAKVYGTRGDYWEETHATISSDGSRIVWATNWNQSVGAENALSVFEIELDRR